MFISVSFFCKWLVDKVVLRLACRLLLPLSTEGFHSVEGQHKGRDDRDKSNAFHYQRKDHDKKDAVRYSSLCSSANHFVPLPSLSP